MFALYEAYQGGLLNPKNWMTNLIAGLIVGIVALPLAMAFAIASGVPPAQGLYTAIISGLVVGVFGGSRVQIAGPTGAFVVILAGITAHYGIEGLQIATLLAGFMLLFMGLIKLGNVIKFIPDPVIVGFTSGIGVIIFVSEWNDFFGLSVHVPLDAPFHTKLLALMYALPQFDGATTALAALCLLLMWFTPKCIKQIPGPLVAMVVATMVQMYFQFKTVATIGSAFGSIPSVLPTFHVPSLDLNQMANLIGPAFAIALLGAIESLLSATAADGLAKTQHHSNQELIGQGLANIMTPLFGGFAATGAIARTATNVRHGGNSPIAAVVHSVFLLLVIVVLAPCAEYIPLSSLAAILFVVAYNMSDVPHFKYMLTHAPRHDVIVLVTTFMLTVLTNLVIAVNVGVIVAVLLFIRRMSQVVSIEEEHHTEISGELNDSNFILPEGVLVYSIQGPFFFGVAKKIEQALAITHRDPQIIVFRLKKVPFMDMTGLQTFQEIIQAFNHRGVRVYLCEANKAVCKKLEKLSICHLIEHGYVFETFTDLIKDLQSTPIPKK